MRCIAGYIGPNPVVRDLLGKIGAVPTGARTYQAARTEKGKVYGGAWTGPQLVLTHAPPETAAPAFTFVSGNLGAPVQRAKTAAGDKYVVILGDTTAMQVLDAGLLHEILIHIAPTLLGDGVRMFGHPGGTNVKLERTDGTQVSAVTNLWLRVKRQPASA